MMGAYEEGALSRRMGNSEEKNPYDDRDAQFDEWEDGWWDQDHEIRLHP